MVAASPALIGFGTDSAIEGEGASRSPGPVASVPASLGGPPRADTADLNP
ncbi:MAG TPA: hypothetical protein VGV57_07570 [Thermoleophilaceae bacterium]|nr:hypothetical protein [Thermoleophilaceae bacterium]